ncbi:hypothetical protein D3C76_1328690 [compost metagenome]
MQRPLLHRLAEPDDHRGRRVHPDFVRGLHHVHPISPGAFQTADFAARSVVQDFRPAARQRIQARLVDGTHHFLQRKTVRHFLHFHNLRRGERVHRNIREPLLNRFK